MHAIKLGNSLFWRFRRNLFENFLFFCYMLTYTPFAAILFWSKLCIFLKSFKPLLRNDKIYYVIKIKMFGINYLITLLLGIFFFWNTILSLQKNSNTFGPTSGTFFGPPVGPYFRLFFFYQKLVVLTKFRVDYKKKWVMIKI